MGTRRSRHNKGRKPLYKEHRGIADPWDKRAALDLMLAPEVTAQDETPSIVATESPAAEVSPKPKKSRRPLTAEDRAEIIRLRIQERLSSCEIKSRTGRNTTSICEILKPYPLTAEEQKKWRAKTAMTMRQKQKALGRRYVGGDEWSDKDKIILERLWPSAKPAKILAAFPGRTWGAIGRQASAYGIQRSRAASNKNGRMIDTVFEALRDIRETQQITRQELAQRLGWHYINIAKWELGETKPQWHAFRAWVQALECDIEIVRQR